MQVLLVEDDIVAARCIKKEFEAADIAVDTVRSATDAMSRTLRATYDLAILDIFVDDGTTISLSNYLRMRSPDTAIMSITGSAAFPCGDHGEVMSADYLFRKPIKPSDVVEIAKHLDATNQYRHGRRDGS